LSFFKKGIFKKWPRLNTIGIIVGSIGIGMLMVIVLPFWVWVVCVGFGCIIYALKTWLF
jgi:hypothetical protein